MYKIKSFDEFINEFELDGEVQQSKPLWNGKDYLNRDGDIDLRGMNLTELPCIFPREWDKSFYCYNNKLTSLQGAPREVGGYFWCDHNQLTSLKGAPKEVGGNFYCYNNKLTSLEGAPREVKGNFICSKNKNKFTEEDVRKACQVGGNVYV